MDQRLPWSKKEGLVYGGVIALITCIVMITFNVCVNNNGSFDIMIIAKAMLSLPLVWLAAMLLMSFVVGRIASMVVAKFAGPNDGFYARITFNIIACVLMMSACMTIIGPSIRYVMQGESIITAFQQWPIAWPRNFCVAFWCEMLLAQPIARALMKYIHTHRSDVQVSIDTEQHGSELKN